MTSEFNSIQFVFLKLTSSIGGFITCYNSMRASSNNSLEMKNVSNTSFKRPYNTGQACSTFYEVRASQAKFCLHAGNMKSNTRNKEWISIGLRINYMYNFIFVLLFFWYFVCFLYISCAIKLYTIGNNRKKSQKFNSLHTLWFLRYSYRACSYN
jgi:hypothetical protein